MLAKRPEGELVRFDSVRVGADRVLVVHGELDISTREHFRRTLAQSPGEGRVLADLSGVSFMDATGLRVLTSPPESVDGRLVLVCLSPQVRRLFDLTAIERRLPYRTRPGRHTFGERNVRYVKQLWEVFAESGTAAMLEFVPDSVEWEPLQGRGRVLRGSRELREFWDARGNDTRALAPSSYTPVDDAVLVRSRLRTDDGGSFPIWSLYEFAGDRLTRASSYAHDAIEAYG